MGANALYVFVAPSPPPSPPLHAQKHNGKCEELNAKNKFEKSFVDNLIKQIWILKIWKKNENISFGNDWKMYAKTVLR